MNLFYQQQFEEPVIHWLDMMMFAEDATLAEATYGEDGELHFTPTPLAGYDLSKLEWKK